MKGENTHLLKKLKEAEAIISVQEAELKKVEEKFEYYVDKYYSIETFTSMKVRAEIMKEFKDGKSSSSDPEADFMYWEQIKTFYSESEEEEKDLVTVAMSS